MAASLAGDHAPRLVPIANRLVRRLAALGVPLGPNVLLTVRGRTSGLPHTFPVALMKTDGRLFIQSPYGQVQWVKNLRADGRATLTRSGKAEEVDAVEVTPEQAGPILQAAIAPYLRNRLGAAVSRVFVPLPPDASADDYVEHVRSHPMFELRPRA